MPFAAVWAFVRRMEARGSSVSHHPAFAALAALAALPLVVAGLSQWTGVAGISANAGLRLGLVYGSVMLAFFAGLRWGMAYNRRSSSTAFNETAVGLAALLAAVLSLMLPALPAVALLVAAYLLHGLWDLFGVESGYLPRWYGALRNLLTVAAVLSLMSLLMRLSL